MEVTLENIKELREKTQLSISDCRNALIEAKGDIKRAEDLLKDKMKAIAAKKTDRVTFQGKIESYIHFDNKIGVLVEINSETDFVAKNEEFCRFAKDMALHIAAVAPIYIKREDVPQEIISKESDKEAFYKKNCLLEQPFVKNPALVIKDYLTEVIGKTGENIIVKRFVRFQLGKD